MKHVTLQLYDGRRQFQLAVADDANVVEPFAGLSSDEVLIVEGLSETIAIRTGVVEWVSTTTGSSVEERLASIEESIGALAREAEFKARHQSVAYSVPTRRRRWWQKSRRP